ncbi:hypothetical protein ASG14_00135 [Pedobacter sp. Leaf194]|nr:hypothetical protein ASG14_00135 [Pedobacter sp. Leaf194]
MAWSACNTLFNSPDISGNTFGCKYLKICTNIGQKIVVLAGQNPFQELLPFALRNSKKLQALNF